MDAIKLSYVNYETIVDALLCKIQTNVRAMELITDKNARYSLQLENECLNALVQKITNELDKWESIN